MLILVSSCGWFKNGQRASIRAFHFQDLTGLPICNFPVPAPVMVKVGFDPTHSGAIVGKRFEPYWARFALL
jgi:hypothetical protein